MRTLNRMSAWVRRRDGSVAVEFALISIPLIYATVAIIELSLFFAASNMVEAGINESARIIRTGQLQEQSALPPEEAFRNEFCNHVFVLVDCNEVGLEVVSMGAGGSFSDADALDPQFDEEGNFDPRDFDAGTSQEVVMIRAFVRYQLFTPLFAQVFSMEENETVPIMSTIVIQSEPYDFDDDEET